MILVEWDHASQNLAYTRMQSGTGTALWTVDAASAAPSPVNVANTRVGNGALGWDTQQRVYFTIFDPALMIAQLFRANADGTGIEQVPGTILANADGEASVSAFSVSPSGTKVAFACDSPTKDLAQLYVLDLQAANAAVLVSNVDNEAPSFIPKGINAGPGIQWTEDETQLAVAATWLVGAGETEGSTQGVFVLSASMPSGTRLLTNGGEATLRPQAMRFSRDGSRLTVLGDLVSDNERELYTFTDFTSADQDPASVLLVDAAVGERLEAFDAR